MSSFDIVPVIWVAGMPVAAALAWIWSRDPDQNEIPQWRTTVFWIGLIAVLLNALLFTGWFLYRLRSDGPEVWRAHDICADVGIALCPLAFIGATSGYKGRASIALSISAVLGFMLWIPIGVL